ncbi:MAG: PilZ domain-containing protein [Nitrospiria bacterium]
MAWKRRFKRLSILSRANVRIRGQKTLVKAYVANISREGVGLYIHKSLPKGSEVTVILHFVDHHGRELTEKIKGKVLWSQKAFTAGISLKQLSKKEHPRLLTFLGALEKSPE